MTVRAFQVKLSSRLGVRHIVIVGGLKCIFVVRDLVKSVYK